MIDAWFTLNVVLPILSDSYTFPIQYSHRAFLDLLGGWRGTADCFDSKCAMVCGPGCHDDDDAKDWIRELIQYNREALYQNESFMQIPMPMLFSDHGEFL